MENIIKNGSFHLWKNSILMGSALVLMAGLSACQKSEDDQPKNDTTVASDASASNALPVPASATPASGDNMSSATPSGIKVVTRGNEVRIHILNPKGTHEYSVSFNRHSEDANGQVQQQIHETQSAHTQSFSSRTEVKSTDNAASSGDNTSPDSASSASSIQAGSSLSKLVVDGKEISTTGEVKSVEEKDGAVDVVILHDAHPQIKDLSTGQIFDNASEQAPASSASGVSGS